MLYRKILFYYSILIATLFLIWIILFMPRSQNLIALILFLPIPLHFFFGIVKPYRLKPHEAVSHETQKGDRSTIMGAALFATIFVSSFSIFIYSLMYESTSSSTKTPSAIENASSQEKKFNTIIERLGEIDATNADLLRQLDRISLDREKKIDTAETLGIESKADLNIQDKNASEEGKVRGQ